MEIKLPDNHKRTLSSSLLLVEKSLTELNELMLKHNDMCCSEVVSDADNDIIDAKRAKIWEILKDTLSGKIKGYGTFPKKIC